MWPLSCCSPSVSSPKLSQVLAIVTMSQRSCAGRGVVILSTAIYILFGHPKMQFSSRSAHLSTTEGYILHLATLWKEYRPVGCVLSVVIP